MGITTLNSPGTSQTLQSLGSIQSIMGLPKTLQCSLV